MHFGIRIFFLEFWSTDTDVDQSFLSCSLKVLGAKEGVLVSGKLKGPPDSDYVMRVCVVELATTTKTDYPAIKDKQNSYGCKI